MATCRALDLTLELAVEQVDDHRTIPQEVPPPELLCGVHVAQRTVDVVLNVPGEGRGGGEEEERRRRGEELEMISCQVVDSRHACEYTMQDFSRTLYSCM